MAKSKPITIPLNQQTLTDFFSRIVVSTTDFHDGIPCWQWTAYITHYGYGQMSHKAKPFKAHRVSFTWFVQAIPEGLVLDHLCRNRKCVNPAHLEITTIGENVMRGETLPAAYLDRTHCDRGHEFTPENTTIRDDPRGLPGTYRRCMECQRILARESYARHAEARKAQKRIYNATIRKERRRSQRESS